MKSVLISRGGLRGEGAFSLCGSMKSKSPEYFRYCVFNGQNTKSSAPPERYNEPPSDIIEISLGEKLLN